jgi:hypothetical protein
MRKKWSLPPERELKSHLKGYYRQSFDERLERYKFLWQEFGPPTDMLLGGGFQAFLALNEIKLCYIEGFYLAVVLLAQIFIENSLGGSYIIGGDDEIAEKGFKKLIDKALTDNLVNDELAAKLQELRKMRNPYVHPKAGAGAGTIMGRIVEKSQSGKAYESLETFAKDDADQAIQTVVDFLRFTTDNGEEDFESQIK